MQPVRELVELKWLQYGLVGFTILLLFNLFYVTTLSLVIYYRPLKLSSCSISPASQSTITYSSSVNTSTLPGVSGKSTISPQSVQDTTGCLPYQKRFLPVSLYTKVHRFFVHAANPQTFISTPCEWLPESNQPRPSISQQRMASFTCYHAHPVQSPCAREM